MPTKMAPPFSIFAHGKPSLVKISHLLVLTLNVLCGSPGRRSNWWGLDRSSGSILITDAVNLWFSETLSTRAVYELAKSEKGRERRERERERKREREREGEREKERKRGRERGEREDKQVRSYTHNRNI